MSPKVPSLHYEKIFRAQQRDGWVVVRQRGQLHSLAEEDGGEVLKITVPAHRPVKRSSLSTS